MLTLGTAVRLNPRTLVRNRYVTQVLLATFGFGILLGIVAFVQTPADPSRQVVHPSRESSGSPQCRLDEPPAPCPESAPRKVESKGDCDFPARLFNN